MASKQDTIEDNETAALQKEIEELKQKAAELKGEVARLESTPTTDTGDKSKPSTKKTDEDFVAANDDNSIYIGNLVPECTPADLQQFFENCGVINRITIMCDKYTGQPKGFAYMEFEDKDSVEVAVGLNETEMNGRPLVVSKKRRNVPKFLLRRGGGRGRGRGRGFRGRGRGRGRYNPY